MNVRLGFRKARFSFGLLYFLSIIRKSSTDEKCCKTEKSFMTTLLRAVLHTDGMSNSFTLQCLIQKDFSVTPITLFLSLFFSFFFFLPFRDGCKYTVQIPPIHKKNKHLFQPLKKGRNPNTIPVIPSPNQTVNTSPPNSSQ